MCAQQVNQAQLRYNQLLEAGKVQDIKTYLETKGYPYPDQSIAHSLKQWARESRTFEDTTALDSALRREWSQQAGAVKSSWGKEA